jgi:hypothetical protein
MVNDDQADYGWDIWWVCGLAIVIGKRPIFRLFFGLCLVSRSLACDFQRVVIRVSSIPRPFISSSSYSVALVETFSG